MDLIRPSGYLGICRAHILYFAHTLNEFGYYTVNGMVMMWTIHVLATSLLSHKLEEEKDFTGFLRRTKSNDDRREKVQSKPNGLRKAGLSQANHQGFVIPSSSSVSPFSSCCCSSHSESNSSDASSQSACPLQQ